MNKDVKISIVIPSYNQGEYLGETLQSIIDQQYDNVEIIVMDGGSTDNSVEVIKKYENYIAYWQSEKDNGQSAAINNGFRRATGEFVTWLNSDDVLLKCALHKVNEAIHQNPGYDIFLGNLFWMNKKGEIIKVGKVESENKFWNRRYLFSTGGPSAFMRKSTLMQIGALREDFHYMMDIELWNRFIATGYYFKRIESYIWGLRLHENAKMSGHNFAQSALADKNHPSWAQKQKELMLLKEMYPTNVLSTYIWRIRKLFTTAFYTRFTDKSYIGKSYSSINQ